MIVNQQYLRVMKGLCFPDVPDIQQRITQVLPAALNETFKFSADLKTLSNGSCTNGEMESNKYFLFVFYLILFSFYLIYETIHRTF